METDNEGTNSCANHDDELSELDRIIQEEAETYEGCTGINPELEKEIKEEAQEQDDHTQIAPFLPQKDEPYLRTPEEEAVSEAMDILRCKPEARNNERPPVDDTAIYEESKEGIQHEADYFKFREELPKIVEHTYFKIFTLPKEFDSLDNEEKEFINSMHGQRKSFIEAVIIYRDGRYAQHLNTAEDEKTIEDKIREYSIRQANPAVSEELTQEEETDYTYAQAVLSISKALEEPEHKKHYLRETRKVLQNAGQEALVESLDTLYTIIQTIESQF